jgi:hypothetical protein
MTWKNQNIKIPYVRNNCILIKKFQSNIMLIYIAIDIMIKKILYLLCFKIIAWNSINFSGKHYGMQELVEFVS